MSLIEKTRKELVNIYINMHPSNIEEANKKLVDAVDKCSKHYGVYLDYKDHLYNFKNGIKNLYKDEVNGLSKFGKKEDMDRYMAYTHNNPFKAHSLFVNHYKKEARSFAEDTAFWRTTEVIKLLIDDLGYIEKHVGEDKGFGLKKTYNDFNLAGDDPFDLHEVLNDEYTVDNTEDL